MFGKKKTSKDATEELSTRILELEKTNKTRDEKISTLETKVTQIQQTNEQMLAMMKLLLTHTLPQSALQPQQQTQTQQTQPIQQIQQIQHLQPPQNGYINTNTNILTLIITNYFTFLNVFQLFYILYRNNGNMTYFNNIQQREMEVYNNNSVSNTLSSTN